MNKCIEKRALILLLILLNACGEGSFDFAEKIRVKSFVRSSNLYVEASDYRREVFDENQPERIRAGTVTEQQLLTLIEKLQAAKNEIENVSPIVLEKIHPGLAGAVDLNFIPATEKQIISYSSDDINERVSEQAAGMTLHNEWIKWLKPRQNNFTLK